MKKYNRRDFLKAAALAVGGAALASCVTPAATTEAPKAGPTPTTAPAAAQGTTITYWVFWGQYNQKVIDAFMPAMLEYIKPNKIDIRFGVDADNVFLPAVAAGTPPDIGTGHKYIQYMSKEQFVVLDEFAAASKIIQKDNFLPTNWEGAFWKGKMAAVPAIECFVRRGLNYNIKMVQDAGLDPNTPPVTWAEAFTWHKALTKFDASGNCTQFGLDPYDAEGSVWSSDGYPAAEMWGFQWWDAQNKKFNLDNEDMANYFDTCAEFIKLIGPDQLAGVRSVEGQGTWGGSFDAQVQAMIIEGYWHPGETFNEKPEVSKLNKATWVPVPDKRKGAKIQVGTGHMVFIYKGGKAPADQTFKVAEFLQTKDHCEPVFKMIGWLPAYKPYLNGIDPSIYPGLDFYVNSTKDPQTEWHGWARCEIEPFLESKLAEVREKHFRGEYKTGKEAAAAFQKAAEDEYKQAGYA